MPCRNNDRLGRGLEDRSGAAHGLLGPIALRNVTDRSVDTERATFGISLDVPEQVVVLQVTRLDHHASFGSL
jgi:hypothetical protein